MSDDTEEDVKRARYAVALALEDGRLKPLETCEQCGVTPGYRGIVGHHHRGYQAPHELDLIWLCRTCHHHAHVLTSPRRCRGRSVLRERCGNYAARGGLYCHHHHDQERRGTP